MERVIVEEQSVNVTEGSSKMLPGCTKEGFNYALQCKVYRNIRVRRIYIGKIQDYHTGDG